MDGTVGWWICGVIFGLMGLPALLGIPMLVKAIQPERRTAVLMTFVLACGAGIVLGIVIRNAIG